MQSFANIQENVAELCKNSAELCTMCGKTLCKTVWKNSVEQRCLAPNGKNLAEDNEERCKNSCGVALLGFHTNPLKIIMILTLIAGSSQQQFT